MSIQRICHAVISVNIAWCSFNSAFSVAATTSEEGISAIETAWRARQAKVHAVRLEWTETFRDDRLLHQNDLEPHAAEATGVLAHDWVEYRTRHQLLIAGERMRYTSMGDKPHPDFPGELVHQEHTSAYDGRVSAGIFPSGKVTGHPSGEIYKHDSCLGARVIHTQAARWCFVPLEPKQFGLNLAGLRVASYRPSVDGVECIALENAANRAREEVSIVIAPAMEYSIVRYTDGAPNRPTTQMDVSYTLDKTSGIWVPAKWTITRLNGEGTTLSVSTALVDSYEINPVVADDAFRIDFPVGTVVTDGRPQADGRSRAGALHYIVRENGGKRDITPDELIHASYEEILSTETGMAAPGSHARLSSKTLYVAIGLTLVIMILLMARSRLRKHVSTPR